MFKFQILEDFKLRIDAKYRNMDTFVDEAIRKNNFNSSLAEKIVEEYLNEELTVLMSWMILLFSICFATSMLPFILTYTFSLKIMGAISMASSLVVLVKYKTKLKQFYTNKGTIMSLLSFSKEG